MAVPIDYRTRPSASAFDVRLGARLRLAREANGLSQQMLSEALDVSFQQLQKYEKGENRIPIERLVLASQTLGIDIGTLVAEQNKQGNFLDEAAKHDAGKLIYYWSQIKSDKVRAEILRFIKSMAAIQ